MDHFVSWPVIQPFFTRLMSRSRGGNVLFVEGHGFHLENLQGVAPATSRLSISRALHVACALVQLALALVPLVVLPAEALLSELNTLLRQGVGVETEKTAL